MENMQSCAKKLMTNGATEFNLNYKREDNSCISCAAVLCNESRKSPKKEKILKWFNKQRTNLSPVEFHRLGQKGNHMYSSLALCGGKEGFEHFQGN